MNSIRTGAIVAVAALLSGAAHAAITISKAATQNMSCAAGQCVPTASDAVLNAKDLANMLASGDVSVATTGSGVEASDILVAKNLKWSGGTTLGLVANRSVTVAANVIVPKSAGLSITANSGGTGGDLTFDAKGKIDFKDVASKFAFNGQNYALAADIDTLASLIAAKPDGNFALASDDKLATTYSDAPIQTSFKGALEGLGHTITNLQISTTDGYAGLFAQMLRGSVARDLKFSGVAIDIENSQYPFAGAVAGLSDGTIEYVQASGTITSSQQLFGGGLVGQDDGPLRQSFANVTVQGGETSWVGGLVGVPHGSITDCYAQGAVSGGAGAYVGGLIGRSFATVGTSYAAGAVTGGEASFIGGFAGEQDSRKFSKSYWDITTSGTDQATGNGKARGVAGLTTEQLQSGLPAGFDPSIWAENANINGGYPYLIDNPPQN